MLLSDFHTVSDLFNYGGQRRGLSTQFRASGSREHQSVNFPPNDLPLVYFATRFLQVSRGVQQLSQQRPHVREIFLSAG